MVDQAPYLIPWLMLMASGVKGKAAFEEHHIIFMCAGMPLSSDLLALRPCHGH